MSKTFSISDLAEEFGVTARTLRFYEDRNLLRPQRVGLARIYSAADRARLAWVLRGRRVGLSLSELQELLDLYDLGDGRAEQRRRTLEVCRSRADALRRQRDDIDATLAELDGFIHQVEDTLAGEAAKTPDKETV